MKKKYWLGILLLFVVGALSTLLYRSGGDRASLKSSDPLINVETVYSDYHKINDIDEEELKEVIEDVGFSTEQFFDAYKQALDSRDTYLKQNIAKTLYSKYGDQRMLPVLVLLSMQQHDIKQALYYLSQGDLHNQEFVATIGVHTIVSILLNTTPLDELSLNRIKAIINSYYDQGLLTDEDKYYYYSLLALAKNDWVHFEYYLKFLDGTRYSDRFTKITQAKLTAQSYKYAPDYYVEGLVGIELFYEGWYNFAQQRGSELLKKDNTYLLGYQLQAYAAILLSDWQKASEMLEWIKQRDDNELYILLQAISLYQNEIYTESILILKQITSGSYKLDALRYLILSYDKIDDRVGIYSILEELLGYELTPYDYFSLFDMLLFTDASSENLSEGEDATINKLITQCYHNIGDKHGFICLYGKAGLLYHAGNYKKALPLMSGLTKWYPTSTLFERIGDVAYKTGDTDFAKRSFLKAFASSRDDNELSHLRNRVTNLLHQK